jgi:hypothetical protein
MMNIYEESTLNFCNTAIVHVIHEHEQLTFRPWSVWKCQISGYCQQKTCEIIIDSYYMFITCQNYNIYITFNFRIIDGHIEFPYHKLFFDKRSIKLEAAVTWLKIKLNMMNIILDLSLISRSCKNDHIIFNVGTPSLETRNIRLVNIITYIIEESELISENMSPNNFHMIYIDDIIHNCMCVIFWTWKWYIESSWIKGNKN